VLGGGLPDIGLAAPLAVAWSLIALAVAVAVWWVAQRELGSRLLAIAPALMLLSAGLLLPHEAGSAVNHIREFSKLSRARAESAGTQPNVPARPFAQVRRIVPEDETFYVAGNTRFRFWAFTSLLPRVAVADPFEADWLLLPATAQSPPGPHVAKTYHLAGGVRLERVSR
jgi:hypothetical protein